MRSAELAQLAGVSVRTLRYYHQIGVLPEPDRLSNGYRNYTADHVVTVLRIIQLTESGLSLEQAGAAISDVGSGSTDEALDQVDRALAAQIEILAEKRARLAQARAEGRVGLSRIAAALSVEPADIPTAIVAAHLYRDDPQMEAIADALMEPARRAELVSLQQRFDAIDDDTTEAELADLAARTSAVTADLADVLAPLSGDQSKVLLDVAERGLNDRQKDFIRRQE